MIWFLQTCWCDERQCVNCGWFRQQIEHANRVAGSRWR